MLLTTKKKIPHVTLCINYYIWQFNNIIYTIQHHFDDVGGDYHSLVDQPSLAVIKIIFNT